MKVVLDTNVLISGTILNHGPSYEILEAWRSGRFLLITSESLIQEAQEKLLEPRIRETYHLSRGMIQGVLTALRKHSRRVPGTLSLQVIVEDPDDDQVIIAAVEGSVDYIISGDPHLRDLGAYQGIKILPPAEFARLLETEPQP
ncbi:MAG: putative toxin-antitoxin system toxin component, PIN family [Candidatus Bipolaricaulia bacterium]